jgi:tRNA nucleotidyltransferase (CCA-adding enzyme)
VTLLSPPPAVLEIAATLERAGFETWCVGGAVRDALLGRAQLDWDLATAATPAQVRGLFRRTVPIGIEFGTVGVLDASGEMHEVTTFRRDVSTDGRHAVVEFGASLDDDLARRDFTINAIAYSPARDVLHDPFDGRGDLARRLVRAVGEPTERMHEDRLRALRAIRFAARFEFDIEAATWAAIVASAPHLGRLSPERVKQELEKTMQQAERPSRAIERWRESGALTALVPALARIDETSVTALDCLPPPALPTRPQRVTNRLAMLWLGHDRASVERSLRALRFSNQESRWIADLADRWLLLGDGMREALVSDAPVTDVTLRRWAATAGPTMLAPLLRLASARWSAERAAGVAGVAAPAPERVRSVYRRAVRVAYSGHLTLADLAVSGSDLMAAGIPRGPSVGRILHRLLDAVVDDPAVNTTEQLLTLAHAMDRDEGTA